MVMLAISAMACRCARSPDSSLPHPRDRQRLLAPAQQHHRQQTAYQGEGGDHQDHQLIPLTPFSGWVKFQRAARVSCKCVPTGGQAMRESGLLSDASSAQG